MPAHRILVDSGFLYALYDHSDYLHQQAYVAAQRYRNNFLIPYVVLTEVTFLLGRSGGPWAIAKFLDSLAMQDYKYEVITTEDMHRISEILVKYIDVELDFVDCCVMALSERLDISQILTFDRRHFSIFRPKHCDFLELLP